MPFKFLRTVVALCAINFIFTAMLAEAGVEWKEFRKFELPQEPKDVALSQNGNWIYLLLADSTVAVYSSDGTLFDTIKTGKQISAIAAGPNEESLILSSKDKQVEILSLEYVREINIEGSPFKGNMDAPVTIVVFMDFQCPYCAKLSPVLEQVLEKNRDKVKIVAKHYPLNMHKFALMAASASMVAHKKNLFWTYHDLLFKNYQNLNEEKILSLGGEIGLSPDEINKGVETREILEQIYKDITDAEKAGVNSIPKIFVNGRTLNDRTVGGFQRMIDQALQKASVPSDKKVELPEAK